jgi:large subunit ribosomal protein L15
MKGQKSRAGYSRRAGFEGGQTPLYQRVPKKRGSKSRKYQLSIQTEEVGTSSLNVFGKGTVVGLGVMRMAGLIRQRGKLRRVKLVKTGLLEQKLTVRVHAASKEAIKQVQAAGGKVETINR